MNATAPVRSVLRRNTFLSMFLFSVPFGLLLYFNSSFLVERGFSEQEVGFVLGSGYLLCVAITLLLPHLLRVFGNRTLFVTGLAVCGILFLLVPATNSALFTAIFLSAGFAIATSLYVLIDIFLASSSTNSKKVGGRRGILLTLRNGAYVIAQLGTVAVLAYATTSHLYTTTGIAMLMLAVSSAFLFRRFRDPIYERYDWIGVWKHLESSRDLRSIFGTEFLLRLFYAVMVVYAPIYLHEHIGISLENLGIVFAVMILPFALLSIPIGRLADARWGEREVLIIGFLITAITTAALAFITTSNIFTWAVALFMTRIGAALVNIGNETYFFKKVRGGDSGEMSAFRVLFPASYVIGPMLGATLLTFLPIQYLFVALGVCMMLGVFSARSLTDTK